MTEVKVYKIFLKDYNTLYYISIKNKMGGRNINNLENKRYWIWLSMIKGLGSKRKQILLNKYKTPEKIYNLKKDEILKLKGFSEKLSENLLDKQNKDNLNSYIEKMEKENINIITIQDKEYPQILKNIYDYPISLYIKGNSNILNNYTIGIVGCRNASEYGIKVSQYFAYNLAKKGINIVSGLAKGIDSYSHIGALKAKGITIGVIGNGLDIVYPRENQYLYDKIVQENGAIISEYPLGVEAEKMNFPARNRIISGMSKGIIVVEAKKKSGTLITVDFALEQGRDVYVVPGNINSLNSVGTNELIKQGAKMVTKVEEIFDVTS